MEMGHKTKMEEEEGTETDMWGDKGDTMGWGLRSEGIERALQSGIWFHKFSKFGINFF